MLGITVSLCATLAIAAPDYGSLRGNADAVNNLGRFLEQYIGDCEHSEPQFDKKGCLAETAERQKRYDGKVLVIEIDNPEEQLHFADWDNGQKAFRMHLTPFFGERALAMTVGKPDRLNKDGLPVMKNIPVWIKLPKGEQEFAFRRQLERSQVRLELLVRARKPWRIKRKEGEGDFRGLDVALVGLRVYPIRGQDVLAEQTY
jgi:hypothetical protein